MRRSVTENTDTVDAAFFQRVNDGYVCGLCPHRCRIRDGGYGRCGTRYGGENGLLASNYGRVSSICLDPVEKKPLYHFHPGESILSVGSVGCNMSCRHCQNHTISQHFDTRIDTDFVSPEELASICRREDVRSVAFTYNEPTVWFEYIRDVIGCLPEMDYVLVTNGLIEEGPLKELYQHVRAMNIDVKGFTERFYNDVCGADLEDVLRTVKRVYSHGIHTELTYLIIPGHNDSTEELTAFSEWVSDELSSDVPVHFTGFHPDNMMTDIPSTPAGIMLTAKRIAGGAGLDFVYLGNVRIPDGQNTYCPDCGRLLIERSGYHTDILGLEGDRCAGCGRTLHIIR